MHVANACRQLPWRQIWRGTNAVRIGSRSAVAKPQQGDVPALLRSELRKGEGARAGVIFIANQPDAPVDRAAEMIEQFRPLTTDNYDKSAQMPAALKLDLNAEAEGLGSVEASITSNGQFEVRAEIDVVEESIDAMGVAGSVSLGAHAHGSCGPFEVHGGLSVGIKASHEIGSVGGKVFVDEDGSTSTEIEADVNLGPIRVSGWADAEDVGGQVDCFGYIIAAERQVQNMDGAKATSAFEHAEDGSMMSYRGTTIETSGTVNATYIGGGMSKDFGDFEAQTVLMGNVCNDNDTNTHENNHTFVNDAGQVKETKTASEVSDQSSEGIVICENKVKSHVEQHSVSAKDGTVVESRITTDTADDSTTLCGIKVGGSETAHIHTETTTTTTETGWFVSTQKKVTITEELEYTQSHSVFSSEIDITKEDKRIEEELENTLTEVGGASLVVLIKPAVVLHKKFMTEGSVNAQDAIQAAMQSALGVLSMAAVTRLLGGPNAAVAVAFLAGTIPKLLEEDLDGVRRDMTGLVAPLLASRFFSAVGTACGGPIVGVATGILGSSLVAQHLDIEKAFARLTAARQRQQRLRLK